MIKVLHIFNCLMPSGAETMWAAAAPILKRSGVETHVLATALEIGPYAEIMRDAGYGLHHLTNTGSRVPDFGYYFALFKLIRAYGYDAVQVHAEKWRFMNAFVARIAGAQAVTTTIHSIFEYRGLRFLRRVIAMRLLKLLGVRIVAISDSVRENEGRYHYKLQLIYNWVDFNRLGIVGARDAVRRELDIDKCRKIVMLVGNCSPIKNHQLFIRAFARLPNEWIAVHIGKEDEEHLRERALAESLGVDGRILFLGSRNDVLRLLECADVFVMCSSLEGLGLSCIEALAKGVPSVVTDVPGLRDIAAHIPLCVKTLGDEIGLTNSILKVSEWTEFVRDRKTLRSKKALREMFDMESNVSKYIELWR